MSEKKPDLTSYSNPQAINQIIGVFMNEPLLIRRYRINVQDFPSRFHRIIFGAIHNLSRSGLATISVGDLAGYLKNYQTQYATFEKHNGAAYVDSCVEHAEPNNIEYYVEQMKKFSLLRSYTEHGIDVSEYFDPYDDPEVQEEKREKLDKESITDIINHFRAIQLEVTTPFRSMENKESKKAGEGGHEMKELWKKELAWGIGYSSAFLTTVLHGMRPEMLTVKTAASGVGKTRTAIADMCYACSPYYYDSKKKVWASNPNGMNNGALFIGTEMKLKSQVDPILWAYLADVPQDHIVYNQYAPGEEERVDKAIDILANESNIWLENIPEFTVGALQDIIEQHILKHNVQYVFFDYLQSTPELIREYQQRTGARIAIQEYQVLANLSRDLKKMAEEYGICINTATQINENYKDEKARDQTLIAGSKAIVNKVDHGIIATRPTANELTILEPIINEVGRGRTPNLVYSVYKARDGKWNNVKIWLDVDYGTMRTHDLFVTGYDCKLIPEIEATYIDVQADDIASGNKAFYEASIDSVLAEDEYDEVF